MSDEINKSNPTRTYKNHTITLNADFRFEIHGPHYQNVRERERLFDAAVDARADIDKRIDEDIHERASTIQLGLRVITDLGSATLINKINRTSGELDVPARRVVYPNLSWVADAVAEHNRLSKALDEISERLRLIAINKNRASGRISLENFPDHVQRLQRDYNKALEEAKKIEEAEVNKAAEIEAEAGMAE